MKNRVSVRSSVLFAMITIIAFSLVMNCFLYLKEKNGSYGPYLSLVGSYCIDPSISGQKYLVFDPKGGYCIYTQADGILESGSYTENSPDSHCYTLSSDTNETSQLLLTKDGVYVFQHEEPLTLYPKFSDVLAYIGNWTRPWEASCSN